MLLGYDPGYDDGSSFNNHVICERTTIDQFGHQHANRNYYVQNSCSNQVGHGKCSFLVSIDPATFLHVLEHRADC